MENAGPLSWMDFSEPAKPAKRERDGRVCVCGHGASSHGPDSREFFETPLSEVPRGHIACTPGRQQCPCDVFFPVVETTDIRRFMSKTVGPDGDHALARGVRNALESNASLTWLDGGNHCGKCKKETGRVTPVAIRMFADNRVVISRKPTPYNYLLCDDCRGALEVEPELW